MLIRLFWGCGAVTGARLMGGMGQQGGQANGERADLMGERADGGHHGYPPLLYDVTDAVIC